MSIANLHSLFNRPWYIDQQYAQGYLPLISNFIKSGIQADLKPNKINISSYRNLAGNLMNGDEMAAADNDAVVFVLDIKAPIVKYDQYCGPIGTKTMISMLDSIKDDSKILGVVLDVDSGGGQAYGTPEFYDYIRSYSKPIVAYTDGMMCSAAYYFSCACDHIMVNKRAEDVGSIGAYTQFIDLSGKYEKEGIKEHTITATKSTEKNKAYMEALAGNYEPYISEVLDPLVDTFITDMKAARPQLNEAVFKGATYNGVKAVEMGLVDSIGTLSDAIAWVAEKSKKVNNSNFNTNTMSKERANLQGVLGLDAPLASNDQGTYLNDSQLNIIENALNGQTEVLNQLKDDHKALITALEADKQKAIDKTTALAKGLNTVATTLGADVSISEESVDVSALTDKVVELQAEPGATHTTAGTPITKEDNKHSYIDFASPMYAEFNNN